MHADRTRCKASNRDPHSYERRAVDGLRLAEVPDLRLRTVGTWRNEDGRERISELGVHGEDRDGRLGKRGAVLWPQHEDEQVKPILLPGVGRAQLRHTRPNRTVEARPLERGEQPGVGARQIIRDLVLAGDLLVKVGRTGRRIASTALWRLLDDRR
jgi:hypothetical protein